MYNKRTMPWKGERDPYKIWLSEIILQQTRVEQGMEYYNRFIREYPTIQQLADAPDEEVFKNWEGLGYYSRCRNLLVTARAICQNGGKFPDDYESIHSLKGVGPYTAAAISSFAYDLPHAVVDGNVSRVLARFFGIYTPVNSSKGKKEFDLLAQSLLEKNEPALYNQAIMDFGATVCKPQLPLCDICPLNSKCFAYQNNKISSLPVKEKKLLKRTRYFTYYILINEHKIWVRKRTRKDIWQNLFEFYLVENEDSFNEESLSSLSNSLFISKNIKNDTAKTSRIYTQQLTHQTIKARFVEVYTDLNLEEEEYIQIRLDQVSELAFPRMIRTFIDEHPLFAKTNQNEDDAEDM